MINHSPWLWWTRYKFLIDWQHYSELKHSNIWNSFLFVCLFYDTYFPTVSFDSNFATLSANESTFQVHLSLICHEECCFGVKGGGLSLDSLSFWLPEVNGRRAETLHFTISHDCTSLWSRTDIIMLIYLDPLFDCHCLTFNSPNTFQSVKPPNRSYCHHLLASYLPCIMLRCKLQLSSSGFWKKM